MNRLVKLQQMLEVDPDDQFLHYAVAKELISTGDPDSGLEKLAEVIERWPDYVPAYFQRGQTLAEQGQNAQARQVIEAGILVARRVNAQHAEMEMTGFLELLRD